MENRPTTKHVPLERVEIRFDRDWTKLVMVSIKPYECIEKMWCAGDYSKAKDTGSEGMQVEDVTKNCDPRMADGFYAFLLAVVGAAKGGMSEESVVLADDAANTFYSVND